jgi:hypothetical protein
LFESTFLCVCPEPVLLNDPGFSSLENGMQCEQGVSAPAIRLLLAPLKRAGPKRSGRRALAADHGSEPAQQNVTANAADAVRQRGWVELTCRGSRSCRVCPPAVCSCRARGQT